MYNLFFLFEHDKKIVTPCRVFFPFPVPQARAFSCLPCCSPRIDWLATMPFVSLLFRMLETVPLHVGRWYASGGVYLILDIALFESYSVLFFENYAYLARKLQEYGIKNRQSPDGQRILYGPGFRRHGNTIAPIRLTTGQKRMGGPVSLPMDKRRCSAIPPLSLPPARPDMNTVSGRVCHVAKENLFDVYDFVFGVPRVNMDVARPIFQEGVEDPCALIRQAAELRQYAQ